jgi:chloramphenicol 3-O phosphotransferase
VQAGGWISSCTSATGALAGHPCGMTATCIVLNGSSCSGKSSIAAVLQEQWPRPLQVTGLDTFLASQSERFFAIDGRVVDGFNWIPATVDGQPAFEVVPGPLGLGMIKASHAYWGACADAGLDQVIDDVWLVPDQPAGLQHALSAANPIWVGVRCPLAVAEQRERARGDRPVGRRVVTTGWCIRSGTTTWKSTPLLPLPRSARKRFSPWWMTSPVTGEKAPCLAPL